MLIVVGNQKAGACKTTIAVHLTAAWASRLRRVVLVDADPQGSARRGLRMTVPSRSSVMRGRIGYLAGDPGRSSPGGASTTTTSYWAGRCARRSASPTCSSSRWPWPADVRAVRGNGRTGSGALRPRPRCPVDPVPRAARHGARPNGPEGVEPYDVPVIRTIPTQRVAVQEVAAMGRSVFDYAPDSLAADEFTALAREIGREVIRYGIDLNQDESGTRAEGDH